MSTPIYIVGPCAAETREQVMETARQIIDELTDRCADRLIFRAGVWKPRTSPHTFQGVGEEGLKWLQEVRETFGVPVATEVATPEHVAAAMEAGIDYLWIGARSSATPIVVQSLADAIDRFAQRKKTALLKEKRPQGILIKNPVNADAELWLGNIERLEKTGVPVMAVHRGCGHKPCWAMAHTVRTARPDIPMLLDPSHLSGDAAKVPALLEKVPELGLDGAMIEVHYKPAEALSDSKQQIRPADLTAALTEHRPATPDRIQTDNVELNWLRAEIDELDDRLWETIAARMDVSRRIGQWKKAHGVAPLQPERYKQVLERIQNTEYRIQTDFAKQLYDLIHEESLKQQQ